MNIIQVALEQFLPNPYQPRDGEDAEHIKKIAESIAAEGLLQVPVGRWVFPEGRAVTGMGEGDLTGHGMLVQLAFGHSRLAAFELLAASGMSVYMAMPVNVREISDEDMFRFAISENLARKDLTPIEEARAMLRYREDFGKTSAAIGKLFGISDSAVRNKMRLLDLPADMQSQMMQVKEGVARELLVLFDLPEEVRKSSENRFMSQAKPSEIVRDAINGASIEGIHGRISMIFKENGTDLSGATWKWDHIYDLEVFPKLKAASCKECPFRTDRDKKTWCFGRGCFDLKIHIGRREYLAAASAVSGIRVIEEDVDTAYGHDFNREEVVKMVRKVGCENLRLKFNSGYRSDWNKFKTLGEQGFPDALIICKKREQFCTCQQAIKAGLPEWKAGNAQAAADSQVDEEDDEEGIELGYVGPDDYEVVDRTLAVDKTAADGAEVAPGLTVKDLEGIARKARAQRRQNLEEIKAIQEDAAKIYAGALQSFNRDVLLKITRNTISYQVRDSLEKAPVEEIFIELGKWLAADLINLQYDTNQKPEDVIKKHNRFLKGAGLREMESQLESVSVETETAE